jgi:polar amino acid transport system substrate-binding protein
MSMTSFTRRQFVRFAAVVGAIPLGVRTAAVAVPATAALGAPAVALASATPFSNGIDASTYAGGDGSYGRYVSNGIRLGMVEEYPVNFTDSTGQRTGWNTDLVMAALGHVGIAKVDYVIGPFQTLIPGLQSSRFDLLASDVHVTPQRIQVIDFTAPVFWYGDTLAVPSGNPANLHSWDGLAGHAVGVGIGNNYAEMLQQRSDLGDLKLYQDNAAMASDLVAGRIDAAVVEDTNFVAFLNQNPLPIDIVGDYVPHSDLADWTRFGVRKEDRDLNNVLSHAFEEMRIDGTNLTILKKYGLGEHNLTAMRGMAGGAAS